jgi:hypothetical protein
LREGLLAEINNREELEAWLRMQPREVAVTLAARAALRVLPLVWTARYAGYKGDLFEDIVLPVFRATAVAWATAKYPAHATRLKGAAASAASVARTAASATTSTGGGHNFAAAAAGAAAMSTLEYPEPSSDTPFRVTGIVEAAINASGAAAANAAAATLSAVTGAAFWPAVSIDATRVEGPASAIDGSPLWTQGQPVELQSLWQELKVALRATKQDWEVWTDWYDDRLDGRVREEERELAYVRIDDALWNQGPAIVNAEIKRRIDEQISYGDLHAIEDSDIAAIAGIVSMGVAEPKPRRRKKERKLTPVPEIPPQQPAALEPVWSNGILVLPSTSAEIDGDPEALASALKVLRQEIAELADDADGEANIDKRPIAYLRRNAGRIPDHAPTQDELFRLAHVKEFLEGYSIIVNKEWPDFLARRFHTLTLHFDRTVRQFPKWRAFVRNANKDRLTPEQAAEVPALAQAMVDALRDEDAREFIDPLIPAALKKLQAPLRSDGENAAQTQLPAVRMEALLIAEDTVESINNIVKEAVAAALPEAKVPKAPSGTRTVSPKATMGIRETAKEALSGFDVEAKKSVIKEMKRLGKETGPAITRWVKRLVFGGSAIAGGTGAAYGLAHHLIHAFPDKFQWLQPLMAFFS